MRHVAIPPRFGGLEGSIMHTMLAAFMLDRHHVNDHHVLLQAGKGKKGTDVSDERKGSNEPILPVEEALATALSSQSHPDCLRGWAQPGSRAWSQTMMRLAQQAASLRLAGACASLLCRTWRCSTGTWLQLRSRYFVVLPRSCWGAAKVSVGWNLSLPCRLCWQ